MSEPNPGVLQQIIDQLSSPVWWFSVGFMGLFLNVLGGLIVSRLNGRFARFSAARRARLDRLAEHRRRLGAALLNKPHLQQLIAQRVTVLRLAELVGLLLSLVAVGGAGIVTTLDPTKIAATPDAVPVARIMLGILFLTFIVFAAGVMAAVSRARAVRYDLEQALTDALLHEGNNTDLLALDEQRRAAGNLPYFFEKPPTVATDNDKPHPT